MILRSVPRLVVAVAGLICSIPGFSRDETDVPVPKPEVKVGDRWIYRTSNYWGIGRVDSFDMRVTFSDGKSIHTVLERKSDSREFDATYSSEWNAVVTMAGSLLSPDHGILRFPLRIGAMHKASYKFTRPRVGAVRGNGEQMVKVVGWEEVIVPAGKFRALKLEAKGTFERLDVYSYGWQRYEIWYVPAVKRWVKYIDEDLTGRRTQELVEFQVQ